MIRWMAEQLHRLARWLEQLGTEPVCNQPHEWPEAAILTMKCPQCEDDYKLLPGWYFCVKCGAYTLYDPKLNWAGLGGKEIGE